MLGLDAAHHVGRAVVVPTAPHQAKVDVLVAALLQPVRRLVRRQAAPKRLERRILHAVRDGWQHIGVVVELLQRERARTRHKGAHRAAQRQAGAQSALGVVLVARRRWHPHVVTPALQLGEASAVRRERQAGAPRAARVKMPGAVLRRHQCHPCG